MAPVTRGAADPAEIGRRYGLVRAAMAGHELDGVLVCGSEYTGFEGAVTYMSGFEIVHRYAYVWLPREGEPTIVFPSEARYVGEHGKSWIEDQVFADRPGFILSPGVSAHSIMPWESTLAMIDEWKRLRDA